MSGRLFVRLDDGYEGPLERLARPGVRRRLMKARGCFAAMEQRFGAALSFGAPRLRDGAVLIVATNRGPRKALNAYKSRWQIECLFGETKTRGFNMEDTRLTQPAKLSLLLAIVALAIAWTQACANSSRPQRHHSRQTWLQAKILVPNRLRHPPTLDRHQTRRAP